VKQESGGLKEIVRCVFTILSCNIKFSRSSSPTFLSLRAACCSSLPSVWGVVRLLGAV